MGPVRRLCQFSASAPSSLRLHPRFFHLLSTDHHYRQLLFFIKTSVAIIPQPPRCGDTPTRTSAIARLQALRSIGRRGCLTHQALIHQGKLARHIGERQAEEYQKDVGFEFETTLSTTDSILFAFAYSCGALEVALRPGCHSAVLQKTASAPGVPVAGSCY